MEIRTHLGVDPGWSGRPLEVSEGYARVLLSTVEAMASDDSGLVHGGFTFSAADHAAMLAVNHPLVVLGSASVRFLAPVWVGQEVVVEARVISRKGKKVAVRVEASTRRPVLEGEFTCFILREPLEQEEGD
jgi:acyl-coenzyme A thioesterase PaaI-like protein